MLDFADLPTNGTKFEQLTRELLLRAGLRPFWSGKGADSGRDLLAEEQLTGSLSADRRLWLVDCKHFAASGRAVGVGDVTDIRDRCERVGAGGFLLVTSTHPSSELVRKMDELENVTGIVIKIWDEVAIEKRLLSPNCLFVAQQFFPKSQHLRKWEIFYTNREERWTANFAGHFLYVESRSGSAPPPLVDLEAIIAELDDFPLGSGEALRVRAIWHDTPNGAFYNCWADYLVPSSQIPELNRFQVMNLLRDDVTGDGVQVNWEIRLQITLPLSDYYDQDDPVFYGRFKEPLYDAIYGLKPHDSTPENPHWWRVTPPPVRTFNDQIMWDRDKEMHGFQQGYVLSPPYRQDP